MKNNSHLIVSLAVLALTSGCATTSASVEREALQQKAEKAELYSGQPEVLFATEFPVASAEEAVARGDRALAAGDRDLALYLYVRAYDLESDNVHALMRIGEIHEARGSSELAARAYSLAVNADPANVQALQAFGLILIQAKRHEEARHLLEHAVFLDPSLWRSHNALGIIADLRGDHAAAVRAFDAALQARPDEPSVLNNRGYSLYLEGKYSEAIHDLGMAAASGLDRAWLNLGLVYARQEKYADAVRVMRHSIAPEVAYNDVGYIALRQGDDDVAGRFFEKAIHLAPRYFAEAEQNLADLRNRGVVEYGGALETRLERSKFGLQTDNGA